MRRRQYLAASGAIVALAGCGDVLGNSEPEETVEAYVDALDDGDAETATDLLHPDGEMEPVTEPDLAAIEEFAIDLEETETVEETEDQAVVAFQLSLTHEEFGEVPVDGELELRTDGEEWRLWAERGSNGVVGDDSPA